MSILVPKLRSLAKEALLATLRPMGQENALTREWAVELLAYAIRVNAVIVAECYTPLYDRWIKTFENPEERLKEITDKIPLENRMTSAEEIANTVAFLLSEKIKSYNRTTYLCGWGLYPS